VGRVAIIGMGLRLPDAASVASYWKNLCTGHDATPRDPRRDVIEHWQHFDFRTFRMAPAEARHLDPHQRLILETSWEAIEDAGMRFEELAQKCAGVFVGMNSQDFGHLLARDGHRPNGHTLLGSTPALTANRVSHLFDLRGPSYTLNAGCASALVALHEAIKALTLGEIDVALAGSVDLPMVERSEAMLTDLGVISKQGRCRSFSADADGYVLGYGGGMVVLVREADVQPSDRVYALIAGSAVTHNGRNEWVSAPNAAGQARALSLACAAADVSPARIDYVEAHGSALPRGDAEEATALAQVFRDAARATRCRLGSVSNTLGYLGAAGGFAGLLRLALSLEQGLFTPTPGVERENPALAACNLDVQRTLEAWPAEEGARIGAVLATSLGGANAALVLTGPSPRARAQSSARTQLVTVSARSPQLLAERIASLRTWAELENRPALASFAYTLAERRSHGKERRAFLVRDYAEFLRATAEDAPSSDDGRVRWAPGYEPSSQELHEAHAYTQGQLPVARHDEHAQTVSLPPPPFDRKRLWPTQVEVAADAPANTTRSVREVVLDAARDALGLGSQATLDDQASVFELGFESLSLFRLRTRLEKDLGLTLSVTEFFESPRLRLLAERLEARLTPTPSTSDDAERRLLEKLAALERPTQPRR
jgi:3-oxoacyl-[acyl-carrier-protein] synthase II